MVDLTSTTPFGAARAARDPGPSLWRPDYLSVAPHRGPPEDSAHVREVSSCVSRRPEPSVRVGKALVTDEDDFRAARALASTAFRIRTLEEFARGTLGVRVASHGRRTTRSPSPVVLSAPHRTPRGPPRRDARRPP